MDKTPIFKASVMTVKLRKKGHPIPDRRRILQKAPLKNWFSKEAKDIRNKVTQLKTLLLENRSAYMKLASHLKNPTQMTDDQRDLIDRESEKFINFYTQHIAQMRFEWRQGRHLKQLDDHIEGVLDILSNYVKMVQSIHLEQKKYRMQQELETYRLIKLAADKKKIPIRPASGSPRRVLRRWSDEDDEEDDEDEIAQYRKSIDPDEDKKVASQKAALDEDILKQHEEKELKPEDIQVFESENVQLFHELQGLSEEVEQIGKNVVDIARLQDIFTEKVALQKHDIERIANAVVGTTENVNDANEQIKQAIQRNAGLRVWVLFFLLVMSFSLLFLDWYNE